MQRKTFEKKKNGKNERVAIVIMASVRKMLRLTGSVKYFIYTRASLTVYVYLIQNQYVKKIRQKVYALFMSSEREKNNNNSIHPT